MTKMTEEAAKRIIAVERRRYKKVRPESHARKVINLFPHLSKYGKNDD